MGDTMKYRKIKLGMTAALVTALPVVPAIAAIDDSVVDEVVADVLDVVDAELSAQVRSRLREQVSLAIGAGVVRQDDLASWGYGITGDTVSPSTDRDRDRSRDQLRERLQDQLARWDVISPEWLRAMEQVREQVRACVQDPTPLCRDQVRVVLEYRHAEQVQSMLQQRLTDADGDDAQVRELEQQRERAQLRVETMLQNGDADVLYGSGVMREEMEQLRERLDTQMRAQSTTTVVPSSTIQEQKGQP
jgi:hypothetical protein